MVHPFRTPFRRLTGGCWRLAALLLLVWAAPLAHAACSSVAGQITINEYNLIDSNNPTSRPYVELKIVDSAVITSSSGFAGWQVVASRKSGSSEAFAAKDLAAIFASSTYSATSNDYCKGTPQANTYIRIPFANDELQDTANVVLSDASGNIVDVFRVSKTATLPDYYQAFTSPAYASCSLASLPYDTDLASIDSNRKNMQRLPDGTGNWMQAPGNGANSEDTLCDSNDNLLRVTKTPDASNVTLNSTVTYTVQVRNGTAGTTMTGVSATEVLPGGLIYVSHTSPSHGSFSSGTLVWSIGSLAAGATASMTITARATLVGSITNTFTATASELGGGYTQGSATVTVVASNVSRFEAYEPGGAASAPKIYTRVAGGVALCQCQDASCPALASDAACRLRLAGLKNNAAPPPSHLVDTADNVSKVAAALEYCTGVVRDGAGLPGCPGNTWAAIAGASVAEQTLSNGVVDVGLPAVANAYELVRVKLTSSTVAGGPWYAADYFAIRPQYLAAVAARDGDWESAGTSRLLSGSATTHKAGRPFSLEATGASLVGGVPATLSGYPGSGAGADAVIALATTTPSVAGGGVNGILSLSAGCSGGAGLCRQEASYSEVGIFDATIADSSYARIDEGDGSAAALRRVAGAITGVGRFVPDHFALSLPTLAPRAAAGCVPASAFAYLGEAMAAGFALTAQRACTVCGAAHTTVNYAGASAKLDPATVSWLPVGSAPAAGSAYILLGAANAPPAPAAGALLSSRVSAVGGSGGWTAGVSNVGANVTLARGAAPPSAEAGPYAALKIGVAPVDADGVSLRNTSAGAPDPFTLDADASGSAETVLLGQTAGRYGRLRLANAYGSELLPLTVPVSTEVWNGSLWLVNGEDSCTAPAAPGKTPVAFPTTVSYAAARVAGGTLAMILGAPGAGSSGTVDLTVDAPAYLEYLWRPGQNDPTARATFGVFGGNGRVIYRRERY